MRLRIVVVFVIALLTVAGCGAKTERGAQPDAAASVSERASASANGVDLTVGLTSVPDDTGGFEAEVDVAVPGDEPVELRYQGGSWGQLMVRSMETSEVVFDSVAVDKEAIASQPAGFVPEESETLSEGGSRTDTYRMNLDPGRYVLTARTFEPVVAIQPIEFDVR